MRKTYKPLGIPRYSCMTGSEKLWKVGSGKLGVASCDNVSWATGEEDGWKGVAKQASDKIWIHKCRFVPSVRIIKARTL